MRNEKKTGIRLAAGIAAAVWLISVPVLAAPKDELEELLKQAEEAMQGSSAVSEYLGLEELEEAIEEKGFDVKLLAGLSDETAENLGLPEDVAENSYLGIRVQSDPEKRQWNLETGLTVSDKDFLNLSLYGDHDLLAMSIPQLYEKAIGIKGGNLYEMLENSWMKEVIIEETGEIPEILRDIDLVFYPNEEEWKEWQESVENSYQVEDLKEQFEDILESFTDGLEIVSQKDDDYGYDMVYDVKVPWDELEKLCQGWASLYMKPFVAAGAVTSEESGDFEEQLQMSLEEMFMQVRMISPEDPVVKFYVWDGKLERILCELPVEVPEESISENELQSEIAGAESKLQSQIADEEKKTVSADIGMLDSSEKGVLEIRVSFWNDGEGYVNIDYDIYGKDVDGNVLGSVNIWRTHTEEGTVSGNNIGIMMMEGEECIYYSDLFDSSFDSSTGEYTVEFSLKDQETSETVCLELEGNFADVVKGQGFTCNYERCAIGEDYEDMMDLTGSVTVQANPGVIEKPQETDILTDLTMEQLGTLISTVEANANEYFGIQSEPESEMPQDTVGTMGTRQ